jgi:hypothetical protein
MTYVKHADGFTTYPYSFDQLRSDNPNTSFPAVLSDALLASFMVYPVTVADEPAHDPATQVTVQDTLPTLSEGVWTLGWAVRDKTPEQITTAQAAQAVLRIAELKRNLAETDYVALSDYDKSKPDVLAQRQAWREEIRTLGG